MSGAGQGLTVVGIVGEGHLDLHRLALLRRGQGEARPGGPGDVGASRAPLVLPGDVVEAVPVGYSGDSAVRVSSTCGVPLMVRTPLAGLLAGSGSSSSGGAAPGTGAAVRRLPELAQQAGVRVGIKNRHSVAWEASPPGQLGSGTRRFPVVRAFPPVECIDPKGCHGASAMLPPSRPPILPCFPQTPSF